MLNARGKQRTDSTHVEAAVRNLNRIKLVGETMRHALNALAVNSPVWLKAHVPSEWYERYGPRFEQSHLPKTENEREKLTLQIGQDGRHLMSCAYAADAPGTVQRALVVEILRRVWIQQYYIQGEEISWRQADNIPPRQIEIRRRFWAIIGFSFAIWPILGSSAINSARNLACNTFKNTAKA